MQQLLRVNKVTTLERVLTSGKALPDGVINGLHGRYCGLCNTRETFMVCVEVTGHAGYWGRGSPEFSGRVLRVVCPQRRLVAAW